MNERKITTHDEVEDVLETEEVRHLGDVSSEVRKFVPIYGLRVYLDFTYMKVRGRFHWKENNNYSHKKQAFLLLFYSLNSFWDQFTFSFGSLNIFLCNLEMIELTHSPKSPRENLVGVEEAKRVLDPVIPIINPNHQFKL